MGLRLGDGEAGATCPRHLAATSGARGDLTHPGWPPEKEMAKKLEQELMG